MRSRLFWFAALVFCPLLEHPGYAAIDCSTDVTGQVNVTRSGYRLYRRENRFVQTVTLKNSSAAPIQGPIGLVLTGLSPNATLANSGGTASCSGVLGSPYIEVAAGDDNLLSPGEAISVILQFSNPTMGSIAYTPKVFAGLAAAFPIGGISITPDGFLTNAPTTVTVHAAVPYSGAIPTVTLERVDLANNVLDTEGALVDSGSLAAGDDISGDGIFSLRKSYTVSAPERIRLRIRAVLGAATAVSQVFFLDAFDPIPDTTFSAILNLENTAETYFNSLLPTQGRQAATSSTIAMLLANSDVLQAGTSDGGNGIWILFKGGLLGGLLLNTADTLGGPADATPLRLPWTSPVRSRTAPRINGASNPEVGSTNVLLLSPFLASLAAWDVNPSLQTLYNGVSCPKYNVTFLSNAGVTVDVFKTLGNYGVINHYGHGDTYFGGMTGGWADFFGWAFGGSQVIVYTGQAATTANKATYQVDLQKGRLAVLSGLYAVLPSFISAYNANLPNSVVFINACRSNYNASLRNAFLNAGAKTYFGYSNYVLASFARDRASDFHNKFALDPNNLVTTGECFTPGLNDGQSTPAYWQMAGATDVVLPSGTELQNGDFETGTLGAWTASGDGRVIGQLGNYFFPTQGSYMGIISTGLGFTTAAGSISQKACLPADSKTLSFDWNFTSEEFREWCGSIYQDYFRVDVVTSSGTSTLFNVRVDDLCSSVFKVPFSFDRGDAWSAGWRSAVLNIAAIAAANAGKSVTIRFAAGDVGDSIYDTAVLLDRIKVNK